MNTVNANNTVKIIIPFEGFYESIISYIFDDIAEMETENMDENLEVSHSIKKQDFAKHYVGLYNAWLSDEFQIKTPLVFSSLFSPREYNFKTDEITCEVSQDVIEALYKRFMLDKDDENQDVVNDKFASCSGFASFYDSFVVNWKTKPLAQWDDNELSVLFPQIMDVYGFYEQSQGNGELGEFLVYSSTSKEYVGLTEELCYFRGCENG